MSEQGVHKGTAPAPVRSPRVEDQRGGCVVTYPYHLGVAVRKSRILYDMLRFVWYVLICGCPSPISYDMLRITIRIISYTFANVQYVTNLQNVLYVTNSSYVASCSASG